MESEYASVLENKEDRENIYKMDSKEKVLLFSNLQWAFSIH